ncbi:MAG TPA: flagellar motor protein MotA [Synergistaceae bacterium]|jgi:biopolymer transport protein ExbB|nr:MAG: Outer membrane transport energization protein ExbB [Synergistales bacterium 53_16]KUL05463.1 MAG: Outer membrane transport energization protein ExbB [Synergistales bacterium 54_9]MDK2845550.1 biopolymer transport protein ExbB [Synergistales bacterium]HAA47110.1 flagellar motor protein MotA [Synergistaceae bacterium]MDN5335321.1 biopolymer transport protein ExbB [Synergistales bacterium]
MTVLSAGGPVIWVITGLSILAAAIVLERLWFYRSASTDPEALELALGEHLYKGEKKEAMVLVKEKESSLHRVFRVAIMHWGADAEAIRSLAEQEVRRELYRWERGLGFLSVIARVAPLLGLLGTILGMIDVFRNLPAMSGANMQVMADGIWKALLTTVAGLSLAVPVILCHAYLVSRVERNEETLWRGLDFLLREKMLRGDSAPE